MFEGGEAKTLNLNAESTDKEANAAIERYGCNCSDLQCWSSLKRSNAAIASYGCDCSSCLNAVRQLQGKLPLWSLIVLQTGATAIV